MLKQTTSIDVLCGKYEWGFGGGYRKWPPPKQNDITIYTVQWFYAIAS